MVPVGCVEWVVVVGGMMIGRGRAVMAGRDFLEQVNWRSLEIRGNALRRREPIPQNLTAKTDRAPSPETAPKFFTHPPIFVTKSALHCVELVRLKSVIVESCPQRNVDG